MSNSSAVSKSMRSFVASSFESKLNGNNDKANNEKIKSALDQLQDGLVNSFEGQQLKGLLARVYSDGTLDDNEVSAIDKQVNAANAANADSYSATGQNPNDKAFGDFQRLFHGAAQGEKFDHNDLARLLPKIEAHRKTLSGDELKAFDSVVANFKNSWQGGQFDDKGWERFYNAQGVGGSALHKTSAEVSIDELNDWLRKLQEQASAGKSLM